MLPKIRLSSTVNSISAMAFGPNFKRKKGVQIGRRHKRGTSYRRAQEQAARAQEQAAMAQEQPPVLAPGDDGPGDPPAIAPYVGETAGVAR